ncbi:SLATT domain-containing protein [Flavobacterium sp.]|uniref:SLATT domain-containing protein n=1 Tax=Flavobacterium sp. TaxID=239 RepID=UPI0031D81B87
MASFEKPQGKEHLDEDFLKELKHKIWSTKGARFAANDRLKSLSKISNICNGVLSVYLIIFGLLTVYKIYNPIEKSENLFAFSLTAVSIFQLLFSLFESSQNYLVNAREFHDCALDLSDLYNELQTFKTYKTDVSEEDKFIFCNDLQLRYQNVLRKYQNHSPIDHKKFIADNMTYYKYIKWHYWWKIYALYYIKTKLFYLLSIIVPGIILIKLILNVI